MPIVYEENSTLIRGDTVNSPLINCLTSEVSSNEVKAANKRKRCEDIEDKNNNFNIDLSCSDTGSDPKKPQSPNKYDMVSQVPNLSIQQ